MSYHYIATAFCHCQIIKINNIISSSNSSKIWDCSFIMKLYSPWRGEIKIYALDCLKKERKKKDNFSSILIFFLKPPWHLKINVALTGSDGHKYVKWTTLKMDKMCEKRHPYGETKVKGWERNPAVSHRWFLQWIILSCLILTRLMTVSLKHLTTLFSCSATE